MLLLKCCGNVFKIYNSLPEIYEKIYQITLKRMFFLKKLHRTRRIRSSHSSWCSFNSRFFAPSLETMKKNFFSRNFSLQLSSAKVERNDDNLARNNFPKSPKYFASMPDKILQKKKSFLMQRFWFSPRTFLWTHRIEFLEPWGLFFSESANFSDHNP